MLADRGLAQVEPAPGLAEARGLGEERRSRFTIEARWRIYRGKDFPGRGEVMLARSRPDEFTLAMADTVTIALILPCYRAGAELFAALTSAAIGLLFFLQGARLSRGAVIAGAAHWRLHLVIFTVTFVLFPLAGLALRPLASALLAPPLVLGLIFLCTLPSAVQTSIAFTSDCRRQCRRGLVQRLRVELRRHGYDPAAGRPVIACAWRVFARCAALDRLRAAGAVRRGPGVAALDWRFRAAPSQYAGHGRSRLGAAHGLFRVQRCDRRRHLGTAYARDVRDPRRRRRRASGAHAGGHRRRAHGSAGPAQVARRLRRKRSKRRVLRPEMPPPKSVEDYFFFTCSGTLATKVEPWLMRLVIVSFPRWRVRMCLTMARPSPVPFRARLCVSSTR